MPANLQIDDRNKGDLFLMMQKARNALIFFGLVTMLLAMPKSLQAASEPGADMCLEVYIVQANDWLSKIAAKFFGTVEAYPAIVAATNQQHRIDPSFALIANPDVIKAGWKLCVPVTVEAEAILTEAASPTPASQPEPAPVAAAAPDRYTLDNFVKEHRFSRAVEPKWIHSTPEPVNKYEVLPEHQANRDSFGYRANYLWNEYLSDDYFAYSGIFEALPAEVKLFEAPWRTAMPRYRYPPNVTLPTGLTTNQFGWRGQQISFQKPHDTIRIAAVGASTTVGGHSLPYSYPELLEHWLNLWSLANHHDLEFEVINAGREGLSASDIAAVVRYEVLPLEVDYVIYYEGSNQFHPETVVTFPPEYTLGQPPAGVVPNFSNVESEDNNLLDYLSEYSAVAARARSIVEQFFYTGQEPPKPEQSFHLPEGLNEFNPNRQQLGNVLALRRILKDLDLIKQDLDKQQVKMVMTTFNWFAYDGMVLDPARHRNLYGYLNRVYWPISYANIRRAADFQNRIFEGWATDQQVPLIDVAGLMPKEPDLYDDAIHNTYTGTRVRAWIIFEALVPMLERDIEAGKLPRPAKLHYAEHPYIKPGYMVRALAIADVAQ
jgi:hypothetical protein